jgi:hypothetical protein
MANTKISALTSATTPLAGTEVLPIVQSSTTVKVAVSDLTAGRSISVSGLTNTGLTASKPVFTDASKVLTSTGVVPVANGGTNVSAASITAFNNITGYTASGATGTTSTNLVFSTSPSITTPTLVGDVTLSTGNLVVSNGKGIDFSATPGTGTSELFADYEEGTWTPTISALTGTITTVTATGTYTLIGRSITASLKITITNNGTGAVVLKTTLPFTPSSTICCGAGRENNVTGVGVIIQNDASVNNANIITVTNTYAGGTGYVITATLTYFV